MLLTLIAMFIAGCAFGMGICMLSVPPVQYHWAVSNFLLSIFLLALVIGRL